MSNNPHSSDKWVLPLRLGSTNLDMPLNRYLTTDHPPAEMAVCYVENSAGRLIVAIYKRGLWLDRKERPLGFTPSHWFKLGAE